jgi:hypothetical protein
MFIRRVGKSQPGKVLKAKGFKVQIDDYVYLVPFVETEDEVFLKTVIPSRTATQKYLKGNAK